MNVATQLSPALDYDRDVPFHAMFEAAAMGIALCHLSGRIVEANPAFASMLGYTRQELAGAHADLLCAELYDDAVCEPCAGNPSPEEGFLGTLVHGERRSFEFERYFRRKDGSQLWGHLTISLGRGARRQPEFLIVTLADATERKRLEEHLREVEKLEVIGRLAGGVAHDFNNLLTGILLYCDLLSDGLAGAPEIGSAGATSENETENELRQHVEEVRHAVEQGAAMTQQLLAIGRRQASDPRPVSMNEIVDSTKNLLRRLIGEQIELITALDSSDGVALADPAQLRQVLLNLVLNARDAMPLGGKVMVSTRTTEFPAATPGDGDGTTIRRAISLAVTDNGCGMDEGTRAHVFEPFFTTKRAGEGTGLGMATVARIVKESGGAIRVDSHPGRGTRIEVFLPAIVANSESSSESSNVSSISEAISEPRVRQASGQEISLQGRAGENRRTHEQASVTILLVDDNASARKSMQRVLQDAGHRIFAASSSKQALRLFAEHSATVDLLIADCMMPGMNGQDLAETLLRQRPSLKVLLISGFPEAVNKSAPAAMEIIGKPFSGKTLLARVSEVMEIEVHSPPNSSTMQASR